MATCDNGDSNSDDDTTETKLKFAVVKTSKYYTLELLRNGSVVQESDFADGLAIELGDQVDVPKANERKEYVYTVRQLNLFRIPGRQSQPLRIKIKSEEDDKENPKNNKNNHDSNTLAQRTDGVIEISRSSVRCFGVTLTEEGNGRYSLSTRTVTDNADREPVRQEVDVKLAFRPGDADFEPNSVEAVTKAVGTMMRILADRRIPRQNIRIVISSGVRLLAKDARLPGRCMDDLVHKLVVALGGGLKIEEIRPVDEAGYLVKEVLNQNELARREGRRVIPLIRGDVVAIDVGSGNVKAAYYNPGKEWVGAFDLEHVSGIMQYMPGTRSLTEITFGKGAKISTNTPDERRACQDQLERKALSEIGRFLVAGAEDSPMLGQSQAVILAGGAAWALCRIARPEDDLTERFVLLNHSQDITHFQRLLLANGLDVLQTSQPAAHGLAERHQKELDKVRKAFNMPQLISGGVILKTVDDHLLNIAKGRQVYFVNDSMFDWLAAYLVERVNEDGANRIPPTPSVR